MMITIYNSKNPELIRVIHNFYLLYRGNNIKINY